MWCCICLDVDWPLLYQTHALLFDSLLAPAQPWGWPEKRNNTKSETKKSKAIEQTKKRKENQSLSTRTFSRVRRSSWFSNAERASLDDSNYMGENKNEIKLMFFENENKTWFLKINIILNTCYIPSNNPGHVSENNTIAIYLFNKTADLFPTCLAHLLQLLLHFLAWGFHVVIMSFPFFL